jgi:hypothetical protein
MAQSYFGLERYMDHPHIFLVDSRFIPQAFSLIIFILFIITLFSCLFRSRFLVCISRFQLL